MNAQPVVRNDTSQFRKSMDSDKDMDSNVALKEYVRVEKVGEGTYGIVYKAIEKKTGRLVAMKKVRADKDDVGVPATTIREISLLKELRHPNIVTLEDIIMDEQRLYLVFEFICMDLRRYLDSLPDMVMMDRTLQKSYLYQILQGICYCHQRRVLHRDLKPQNLLVDQHGTIKIADFGLARAIGIPIRAYTHEIVTLWYRAPEILLGSTRYSMAIDMWSIGCIYGEIITKYPLFHGDCEIDQIFRIFRVLSTPTEECWRGIVDLPDYKPSFPAWTDDLLTPKIIGKVDDVGADILRGLLAYDPVKRYSAKTLLKHPYFMDVDKSKLPAGDFDGTLCLD